MLPHVICTMFFALALDPEILWTVRGSTICIPNWLFSGEPHFQCGPGGSRTLCLLIANEVFKPGKLQALNHPIFYIKGQQKSRRKAGNLMTVILYSLTHTRWAQFHLGSF